MDWIYEGTLKNRPEEFKIRTLVLDDLDLVLKVQEQVIQVLKDRETLQPLTREEFQYILEGNGLMIGSFVGGELIAFRALLVPVADDEHLGWDIGLSEAELSQVIYQEISNVLPAYRGNQLQKILARVIMEELGRQKHPYRYICCTVAPFNIPSLKDKFAQGMQIAALKEKYGGRLRYIFVKDLKEGEESAWKETITIPMSDIETQKQKLAKGWRGIKMEESNDKQQSWTVIYIR